MILAAGGRAAAGDEAPPGTPLDRSFFARPAATVAPELLGMLLLHRSPDGIAGGVVVETEAYGGPDDLASHARAGLTRRTAPMFGPPGHAYVYLVYGLHSCLNVVTERDGAAGAVLLRALAPTVGVELMRARRARRDEPDARLAAGPARLCQALAVDRGWDGAELTGSRDLWLADPGAEALDTTRADGVVVGPRIGVAYAGDAWAARSWRFGLRGHPALSRRFPPEPSRVSQGA